MDGRWKLLAWSGLCAAAVGCNRNAVNPPPTPGFPTAAGKPSLLQTAFGGNPKFAPPPSAEPVVVRDRRPRGEGPKPETLITLAETEVDAAFDPSRSGVERDQLLDSARQKYQKVLEKDAANKGALLGTARMYAKAGDKDRAVAAFQTAVNANPADHELVYQMATTQARLGDWAGAAESCERALAADPENRTYRKTLGYCQGKLGQWEAAFASLSVVMPEAQARYFVGRAMLDENQPADGRKQIELAVQANPEYAPAQNALAYLSGGPAAGAVPAVPATGDSGFTQVGHQEPPVGER
ncbi:MAG: tetratricopeptide repeat protein [Fimbriiglobus sp.]